MGKTRINVLVNIIFATIFICLNIWALENKLEETFITLAICYGIIIIVFNALYVSLPRKK